ncbi:MAG: hypothetical protein UU37_C0001G0047 [Candidatus Gottesmanbacteria bacterium GW2011_GWA2_41_12]|uniref:Uncharacterized protein n=1 Tax=Candidatus Gottesmanbacteria bacterium GW2011_GWA2_41_12 TaxID=1618440 RepID=A0A0G0UIM3_9BACT|nr:MAG: hypothetical protein UU37_C0001G0047 [Candidatus Gottesmanbacteria bacterium GW2011_GWA2_41_12]
MGVAVGVRVGFGEGVIVAVGTRVGTSEGEGKLVGLSVGKERVIVGEIEIFTRGRFSVFKENVKEHWLVIALIFDGAVGELESLEASLLLV